MSYPRLVNLDSFHITTMTLAVELIADLVFNSQTSFLFFIDILCSNKSSKGRRASSEPCHKAFYDILLTEEQLKILDEDILRQERQVRDSKAKLDVGLVDKTDYLRASVSARNTYGRRPSPGLRPLWSRPSTTSCWSGASSSGRFCSATSRTQRCSPARRGWWGRDCSS